MAEQVDLDLDDDVDLDFDEDWAEEDRAARPPSIRLLGERVELPPVLPALLVLFVYRARSGADDAKRDVKPTEIVRLVGLLIGQDRVQRALDSGIGFERLARILYKSIGLYRDRPVGEATAPAGTETGRTGSDSSSGTGASSSPTGDASTEPTSEPSSQPV